MQAQTVKTRILILSDTHALAFPSPSTPFSHPPPPKIDILIHCGDLTRANHQNRNAYIGALDLLAAIPAKLKLVIAGNHDIALDPEEWANRGGRPDMPEQIVALMNGEQAKKDRVVFLNEGVHTFDLENCARIKVYATPYTPLYSESAFKYPPNEDRFNLPEHISEDLTKGKHPVVSVGTSMSTVPSWPMVDIMMTHGPPLGGLDMSKKGKNVGCANLMRAVERARPRIHCFGHVHEGYGAQTMSWENQTLKPLYREPGFESDSEENTQSGQGKSKVLANSSHGNKSKKKVETTSKEDVRRNPYPEAANLDRELVFGEETIMVNAAIRERGFGGIWEDSKLPWVLEIELPVSSDGTEVDGDNTSLAGLDAKR